MSQVQNDSLLLSSKFVYPNDITTPTETGFPENQGSLVTMKLTKDNRVRAQMVGWNPEKHSLECTSDKIVLYIAKVTGTQVMRSGFEILRTYSTNSRAGLDTRTQLTVWVNDDSVVGHI